MISGAVRLRVSRPAPAHCPVTRQLKGEVMHPNTSKMILRIRPGAFSTQGGAMPPATRKSISYALLISLALACLLTGASAQGLTGQISGTLNDPNGGVVPGAKVEVINQETAQARAVTSDSEG